MKRAIQYTRGQEIGPYHNKYIKEAEPDKDSKRPNKKIRKAEFECGNCGKHFVARISNVKNGHTKSCGCKNLESSIKAIQEYNALKLPPWNRKEYIKGQVIGNNDVIYIQEKEPKRHGKEQGLTRYAEFKCPICGNHFVSMVENVSLNKVKSCGQHTSLGENKIATLLQTMGIDFKPQKTFEGLGEYSNQKNRFFYFPFDFYIPNLKLCIEYDGIQHFSYHEHSEDSWNNKENFQNTREHDEIKNKYCKDNYIYLVRIPYIDFDEIDEKYIENILDNYRLYDYNHNNKRDIYQQLYK